MPGSALVDAVRYDLRHRTRYEYGQTVSVSHHVAHLRPRELPGQRCLSHSLEIDPEPSTLNEHLDYHGNPTSVFTMEAGYEQLIVTARSRVEVLPIPRPDPEKTPSWEIVREVCAGRQWNPDTEAGEFAYASPLGPVRPDCAAYAAPSFPVGRPILVAVLDLTKRIFREFRFDPGATTVSTRVETVLRNRRGVCQDFAHLQIACLRSLGLPARYVSGYLETIPPAGQTKLVGSDASHAWVSFWCPGHGWVDVDPTNNVLPSERHITLGWGRDYGEVSPLRGVSVGSGRHALKVEVDVIPVPDDESPPSSEPDPPTPAP